MKSIKGLFAAVMAAVCVITLSVSAFAATSVPLPDDFLQTFSTVRLKQKIPASQFTDSQLNFWKEFMEAFSGNSKSKALIFASLTILNGAKTYRLFLVLVNSDYTFKGGMNYAPVTASGSPFPAMFIQYEIESGDLVNVVYPVTTVITDPVFSGFGKIDNWPSHVKYYGEVSGKNILISDDLEPDGPSEPDESIPETPSFPPYNPVVPEIPSGGGYVLYDTSVWWTFLERIRICIGSATNIGFLIFGLSVVWALLVRIIKRFSSPGS